MRGGNLLRVLVVAQQILAICGALCAAHLTNTADDVADISCGGAACVARKTDDTAVAWGSARHGGDASSVDLTNVADISEL